MAGNDKSFGALAFRRILRNIILGAGEIIPNIKGSNVKQVEEKSGFEGFTEDLVTKEKTKGKVVVTSVTDTDEIIDMTDEDEIISFDLPDEMPDSEFFTKCGMYVRLCK